MSDLLIKICGVRSPEIARVVAENGADLMGLIFAPARRQVTEVQARQIVAGLRFAKTSPVILSRSEESPLRSPQHDVVEAKKRSFAAAQDDRVAVQDEGETARNDGVAAQGVRQPQAVAPRRPKVVGVFVNESVDEMNRLAESVGLDYIQLSGDEPVEVQAALNRPVIRVLRLPSGMTPAEARNLAEEYLDCSTPAMALMLDTHVRGAYGGTGIPGDWNLARALAERCPVILAGGLRPETVGEALSTVHPFGVDVSSGVETDGDKDAEKIGKFIAAARAASIPAGRS